MKTKLKKSSDDNNPYHHIDGKRYYIKNGRVYNEQGYYALLYGGPEDRMTVLDYYGGFSGKLSKENHKYRDKVLHCPHLVLEYIRTHHDPKGNSKTMSYWDVTRWMVKEFGEELAMDIFDWEMYFLSSKYSVAFILYWVKEDLKVTGTEVDDIYNCDEVITFSNGMTITTKEKTYKDNVIYKH